MITAAERARIREHASVLEQMPVYVEAITGAEPLLLDDFVAYRDGARLVIVGYPLEGEPETARLDRTVRGAIERFDPAVVVTAAPEVPAAMAGAEADAPDAYYRLDLAALRLRSSVRNMVRRGARELTVTRATKLRRAHRRMLRAFVKERRLDDALSTVFGRTWAYAATEGARVYEARDARGRLVAFDVAEFGGGTSAFYVFNVRSSKRAAPGASDLLLHRIAEDARAEGKRFLNLGLGVNDGVRFFKEKWGGVPFARHVGAVLVRYEP